MNKIKLKEICDFQNGCAFKSGDYVEKSNTLNCRMSNIRPDGSFDAEYNKKYLPDEFMEKYSSYKLENGDLVIAMTDMAGDPKILGVPAVVDTKGYNMLLNQRVGKLIIKDEKKYSSKYIKYALSNPDNKEYFKKYASGGLQINIGKDAIMNIEIPDFPKEKQDIITDELDRIKSIVDLKLQEIEKLDELIESKFDFMFRNTPEDTILGDIVSYEQPTKYIVENDNYDDKNSIPVLTAGKSFILGYTNETTGIFPKEKLPVLIFDDFTTSIQLVDFAFKVKSSAMKILHCNDAKIKVEFAYYMIKNIEVDSQIHKRYWISEYAKKKVKCPSIEKQEEFSKFVQKVEESKKIIYNSINELNELYYARIKQIFGGEENED